MPILGAGLLVHFLTTRVSRRAHPGQRVSHRDVSMSSIILVIDTRNDHIERLRKSLRERDVQDVHFTTPDHWSSAIKGRPLSAVMLTDGLDSARCNRLIQEIEAEYEKVPVVRFCDAQLAKFAELNRRQGDDSELPASVGVISRAARR